MNQGCRAAFVAGALLASGFASSSHAQNAAFLTNFQTNIWAVTQTNAAMKNYFVPTTNADQLWLSDAGVLTNRVPQLGATVGFPNPAGGQPYGVINYLPTAAASTNTFTLVASNTANGSAATNWLTIVCQPLAPLEVRVYDMRSNTAAPAEVLAVGTGGNDKAGLCSFYYDSGSGFVSISNGYSVAFSNLPVAYGTNSYGTNIPYRTLYVSNVQSGTLWFGMTDVPYTNALVVGNPAGTAAPDVQWSDVPFGELEYAYTGGGYDTADVTMINELGVPLMLRMANASGLYPGSSPVGVTNSNNLATAIPVMRRLPGANWFGAAPHAHVIRLLGPSSAQNGGVQMANGSSKYGDPDPAGTNAWTFQSGWPGFAAMPMSPFVTAVAERTTNTSATNPVGQPWGTTKIAKQIGDPDAGWAASSIWYFTAELSFLPNTNAISDWGPLHTNYVTPVPVLTNITITNIVTSKTNANLKFTNSYTTNGLAVAFTPDRGSPTNAAFSCYIYGAPPSFIGASNQGYVTFFAGGATNQFYWTNLANYPGTNTGASGSVNSPNWNPYVLDAFLNEIAFGFAGGFVQSPVFGYTNGWITNAADGRITGNTNPAAPSPASGGIPIGMMDSAQWWQQTNVYASLQPGSPADYTWYSQWGNAVLGINPTIYSHPISDRLQYQGFTPGMPLGAANTNTNAWMEVYLYDEPAVPSPGTNRPGPAIIQTNGVTVNLPTGYFTNMPFGSNGPNPANMIVLNMSNYFAPSAAFPTTVITGTNTNGGGVLVSAIPNGLTYDPDTRTIAGTASNLPGGWASIGLMFYNSNDVTITELPVYVNRVNTDPLVTNVVVTNNWAKPTNIGAVAFPGETVTIQGLNFTNFEGQVPPINKIVFGAGVETTNFNIVDQTSITAVVPSNGWAAPFVGSVVVERVWTNTNAVPVAVVTNGVGWTNTFGLPLPFISSFSPTNGVAGQSVTLDGFFYPASAGSYQTTNVSFGPTNTPVYTTNFSVDPGGSQLVVVAPGHATNGPICVYSRLLGTSNYSVVTVGGFIYSPAQITGFSPTQGSVGTPVNIFGTNFGEVSKVIFNTAEQTNFTVVSTTNISTVVPADAMTGPIQVVTAAGTASSTNHFIVPAPTVNSFSPAFGTNGATINIFGSGFLGATNVAFGDFIASSFQILSATNITAIVPAGLSPMAAYRVRVLAASGVGQSSSDFTFVGPGVAPVGPLSSTNVAVPTFGPYAASNSVKLQPWYGDSLYPSVYFFSVANNNTAMLTYYDASFSASNLPRGLYLSNVVMAGNIVEAAFFGAAVDGGVTNTATITASNSAGVTNFTIPIAVSGFVSWYPSSGPQLYGPTTFNVSAGQPASIAVTYSNAPTYFELAGLPSGLTNSLAFAPSTGDSNAVEFALSIVGTTTNTGTFPVTVTAVNAAGSQAAGVLPRTNIATITIIVANASPFLIYPSWLTNYPSVTGTNTNTVADPDSDVFENIVEYAFDGDPSVASPAMLHASNAESGALFRYVALKGADTNYTVQGAADLLAGPWTNTAITPTNSADQSGLLLPASYERKEFFVPYTGTNGFYRIIFSNP